MIPLDTASTVDLACNPKLALKIMARDGNCDFAQLRIKVVKMTLNANGVVVRSDVSGLNNWSSYYGSYVYIESWMQIKM